jgi:hypothetical protein
MERVFKDPSSPEESSSRSPLELAANQSVCLDGGAAGPPASAGARTDSQELSRLLGGIGGAADSGVAGQRLSALLRQLQEDMRSLDEEG